jgi:hypothetical protein
VYLHVPLKIDALLLIFPGSSIVLLLQLINLYLFVAISLGPIAYGSSFLIFTLIELAGVILLWLIGIEMEIELVELFLQLLILAQLRAICLDFLIDD